MEFHLEAPDSWPMSSHHLTPPHCSSMALVFNVPHLPSFQCFVICAEEAQLNFWHTSLIHHALLALSVMH